MTPPDDAYLAIEGIVSNLLSVIDQMDTDPRMSDDRLQSMKIRCAKFRIRSGPTGSKLLWWG